MSGALTVRQLGRDDLESARELNALFAKEFGDPESYAHAPPGDAYLAETLDGDGVIVLVAEEQGELAGALVGYVLPKLEQERSEIYIYDLAVVEHRRRQGIATRLIEEVQRIASEIGAWVIYVQADYVDEPAVALYTKLGTREDVMHFDIPPRATR